jgi:hypothetical protein
MRMRRVLLYLDRLWTTDISLTTLLVFLLIYIFFLYPLGQVGPVKFMAFVFFSLILAISLQIPGAFSGLGTVMEGDKEVLRTHFQYFSFTVLTTVGFGDIVPVAPIA